MRSLLNFYWKKCILAFLVVCVGIAHAADIEVRSRLSDTETPVGVPVRLEIIVQGARSAEVPRDLGVDGLQARYVGESVQMQMINFQVSTSSSYTFVILPLRPGNFTIPDLEIKVNGRVFRTQPLHLTVYDSTNNWGNSLAGGSQTSLQSSSAAASPASTVPATPQPGNLVDSQSDKLAFGVLIIPKKRIYVGEVLPVEIRYYFHPDLPVQSVNSMPSLIGDNFVVRKIPEPHQGQQVMNGVRYMVLSFRSSIRPLTAGELQLPSTSIACQVLTQARPELPPGMTDAFFQRFLDSMPGITRVQKMEVKSPPVMIQAIPLPEENRPDSFHGAIGKFSLHMEASPRDPSPGDPVTLRAIVSGEGNFDQITAPDLVSKQGWQSYPPSSKFSDADPIGYLGKKIFEWILVSKEKRSATPGVKFSYFDPNLSKYITLRGPSQPVNAEPLFHVTPPQVGTIPISAEGQASPPVGRDKFRIAKKLRQESFQPITTRPEFAIANAAALLALLAFIGIQLIRRHSASGRGEKAALRHALMECQTRASASQGKEFYSAVVEFLRLQARITSKRDTKGASAEEVVHAIGLQGEEAELALNVFARYEELAYGRAKGALSLETRKAVLKLLKQKRRQ